MPETTICREYRFEASHQLPWHDGKCKNLHGHSYRVEVEVYGAKLHSEGPQTGMIMDFGRLDAIVQENVLYLDHQHLNDHIAYPTAEHIAWLLWNNLRGKIDTTATPTLRLRRVRVWETARSWAEVKA